MCMYLRVHDYLSICLSVCLPGCLPVLLSVCLSACMRAYKTANPWECTLPSQKPVNTALDICLSTPAQSPVTRFPQRVEKPTLGRGKMSRRRSSSVWSCRNSCVAVLWHSVLHLHLGHDKHICINRLPHTLAAFQLQGCKPEA